MEAKAMSTASTTASSPLSDEGKERGSRKFKDEDLEYDITFPSADKQLNLPTAKEPVVYLLGWAGCKDKHLSKYGAIYEDQGCITIRYIAPVEELFKRSYGGALEEQAYSLLGLLEDFKLEEHPLFFHAFSNGGAFVYSLMNRHFRDDVQVMSKIRGVIFDSGPARVGFWQCVSVMATFVRGRSVFRYTVAFFWALAMWFYSALTSLGSLVLSTRFQRCESAYDALLAESPLCPQLFLYSEKDAVCSHQSIRAFADARRTKGVPVEEVFWQDSPHVQHFVLHRNQYVTSVTDFMRRCLEGTIQVSSPIGKKNR
ncbi:hypothetical protein HPB49_025730 [Dermacentor silvarum]|uniref:transmembrane protein 53-B n=1 Tax=Dermacentor silvarum TaxID=543639 RepID=UPI0018970FF7|nr:transmembrane protein 53-B [Dermacentor silvarum]KAH7984797.1 hypothetical protein HPB49_025730 [Dermacentor silvarum]